MGIKWRCTEAVAAIAVVLSAAPGGAHARAASSSVASRAKARAASSSFASRAKARAVSSPTLTASVTRRPVGSPIAPGFVGLSIEFQALRAYTGTDPAAINPILLQLIRNLTVGSRPVLRIGGDSTDDTWWPVRGVGRPHGISYGLRKGWMRTTRALAQELDARLILGVNLAANLPSLAVAEGREYVKLIGRSWIDALEIGNEPDLYSVVPWYRVPGGTSVFSRGSGYSMRSLIAQFSRWRRRLPALPIAGPALATPAWMNQLGGFLGAEPGVRLATIHRYPLSACERNPGASDYPSIANLLSQRAISGLARPVGRYAASARAHNAKLRVAEMNSVSCRGRTGVSDTFASALWTLQTLFALARQGVAGVNVHTLPGAAYELFTFSHSRRSWSALIHPDYYGLELFAQAAPPGSRLLAVHGSRGPLTIWATRDLAGTVRVVLINDDPSHRRRLRLELPPLARLGQSDPTTVEWLTAPSLSSTSGVKLGGESFGRRSTTGRLPRPPHQLRARAVRGRTYAIDVPAGTAALLTRP